MQANPTAILVARVVVVLDANIALNATFPDEKLHARAKQLLAALDGIGARFISPPLWESETSSAVRMRVMHKKTTAPGDEATAYALLDALPIEIVQTSQTKAKARELAIQLGLNRAYDATYLALAVTQGATLWTADERFYNAVASAMPQVKYLGNWQPGDELTATTVKGGTP